MPHFPRHRRLVGSLLVAAALLVGLGTLAWLVKSVVEVERVGTHRSELFLDPHQELAVEARRYSVDSISCTITDLETGKPVKGTWNDDPQLSGKRIRVIGTFDSGSGHLDVQCTDDARITTSRAAFFPRWGILPLLVIPVCLWVFGKDLISRRSADNGAA